MKIIGVYVIRNTVSGRVYVGSSLNVLSRWSCHKAMLKNGKHHSIALQRSWDKHGYNSFVFEHIEIVEDASAVVEREQYWIDTLKAADPLLGMNMHPNARSRRGYVPTEESRRKMSLAAKRRPKAKWSEERRARNVVHNKGKSPSEEVRRKMSESQKGKIHGPPSEETRRKISAASKRNGIPAECLRRAHESNRGRITPEHVRKKMSESHKRRSDNPEVKASRSEAATRGWKKRKGELL